MQLPDDLPFVVHLDDCDTPADAIDALLLGGFVAGALPAARTASIRRLRPDAALLPPGVTARLEARDDGATTRLAVTEHWVLRSTTWGDATGKITVIARTDALAEQVIRAATADAIEPVEHDVSRLPVGFWHMRAPKAQLAERPVEAPEWWSIRENYTARAASVIDDLVATDPETVHGRLVLLHGPPGTGKTTVLRSLARAWRAWCRLEVVLDPERLLQEPAYLSDVLLGRDTFDDGDAPANDERWRMLVLEDCDELIRSEAKQGVGQALARLLNLTDGLLGQGSRVLVSITTNEELTRLHPAVTRPGRCLGQVHVDRLSAAEAAHWLGEPAANSMTLAELFARRADRCVAPSVEHVGLYL